MMKFPIAKIALVIAALATIPLRNIHARDLRGSSNGSSLKRSRSSASTSHFRAGTTSSRRNNTARSRSQKIGRGTRTTAKETAPEQAAPTVEIFRDEAALLPARDDNSSDNDAATDDNAPALIPNPHG